MDGCLLEMGTPVNQPIAGVLLDDLGFAKRQIEKTIDGGNVPERQQQLSSLHLQARLTRAGQRKANDAFRESSPIQFDSILPSWNYTAIAGAGI